MKKNLSILSFISIGAVLLFITTEFYSCKKDPQIPQVCKGSSELDLQITEDNEWKVYTFGNVDTAHNYISSIKIDRKGITWIGTLSGLIKFDNEVLTLYDVSNSPLPFCEVAAIAIGNNNEKWIATSYLSKYDRNTWTTYGSGNSDFPLDEHSIGTITIDENNNVWAGGYAGLVKYDGANWRHYNQFNSELYANNVEAIVEDQNANIWIGTFEGLSKFDGTNWSGFYGYHPQLPAHWIYSLAIDKDDNLWVGTFDGGIGKYDGTNWEYYNVENSELPSNRVREIAFKSNGDLVVGTQPYWNDTTMAGGGLAIYNGSEWKIYDTLNSIIPSNQINTIAIDQNNKIWIGTNFGFAVSK